MVHARSCSFWRTTIGQLQWSLQWWPPRHCSVPPLPPATLIGLISDLCRNSSSTLIPPPTNHHSYHYHYQPAPCTIYHSTTRGPPRSTHIPCHRPIILRTYQFSRSWVLVATLLGQLRLWLSRDLAGDPKHIYKHKYDRKVHLAGDPKRKG